MRDRNGLARFVARFGAGARGVESPDRPMLDASAPLSRASGNGLITAPWAESELSKRGSKPGLGYGRPRAAGKFLFVGDEKFYVRGVTYGTFRPTGDGPQFPTRDTVELDFASMAANGINAVRLYTVPPRWLLDLAQMHGLRVMIGIPWEQHIAFLEERERPPEIVARVRAGVRACAGHPAVLCYAVGSEIPASIVRWYGPRRVERFIERLYRAAKAEDPDALVTYVNFPSTEYLRLPFLDFTAFNVYLEDREQFGAYLARLQNLTGDRPLLMAEAGLDSRRHGEEAQAHTLDEQVRAIFAAGCAGTFVFSWTDEWYRGGYDVDDWDFGLTDRQRNPKPALDAVRNAFAEVPFPRDLPWPRISVVVCSYNGERTIRDCLDGLGGLAYPDFEVIVVDDGSNDKTAAIAREYGFRVISSENRGLSSARNTGLEAAGGEIVAYTDDDARPDPHWLTYLAATFMSTDYVGVGGPNVAPPGDGPIAACVANAPGGPLHVLLDDREAEHIPGCNMAYRREYLQAIGGFDPQFRAAGDDVDVCWRLQEHGWRLGFSPAAVVWHHRRNSVRTYWKQQYGYGKAEALLERKWPEKYNAAGHVSWAGRLYGKGLARVLPWAAPRIYHGQWGSALFQSIYQPGTDVLSTLPLMPEWFFATALLAALAALGVLWVPMFLFGLLFVFAVGATMAQAVLGAAHASFPAARVAGSHRSRARIGGLRTLTMLLHLIQPLARLYGRLDNGLSLWRRRGAARLALTTSIRANLWSEQWRPQEHWLEAVEDSLRRAGAVCLRGGSHDRWDLEVRGGLLGRARLLLAVEEHGAGRQLVRVRAWPVWPIFARSLTLAVFALTLGAALNGSLVTWAFFVVVAAALTVRAALESGRALGAARHAVPRVAEQPMSTAKSGGAALDPLPRQSKTRIGHQPPSLTRLAFGDARTPPPKSEDQVV